MGWFDRFRGTKSDQDTPIGMGVEDDQSGGVAEGGPSIFVSDLARLRWTAQKEAVVVGNTTLEPEDWAEGRLAFEYERALAHEHEALRDRLSNWVATQMRGVTQQMHVAAAHVGVARDSLRAADVELVTMHRAWGKIYDDVQSDELELGRYFRLRSRTTQTLKWAIAIGLFLGECAVSVGLFNRALPNADPEIPYIFSFSLVLMLVLVPHYAAVGLKEGLTKHHQFEHKALRREGTEPPHRVAKKVHMETVDDWGFRVAASVVGLALLALLIPLSSLRASELTPRGASRHFWFWFYLLVQVGISGYFFLREWLDHGSASHNLKSMDEARREALMAREQALAAVAESTSNYHALSEMLLFLAREAPRWDSQIIEEYLATIRYFRHIVTSMKPDQAPFVTWARVPHLGFAGEEGQGEYLLDPVSREHPGLDEDSPRGRRWWLQMAERILSESLVDGTAPAPADLHGEEMLGTMGPNRLLREILRKYYDLDEVYERSEELDEPASVTRGPTPSAPPAQSPEARHPEAASPVPAGARNANGSANGHVNSRANGHSDGSGNGAAKAPTAGAGAGAPRP